MEHQVNRAKALWEHWELREKELGTIGEMTDEHAADITRQKYNFLREGYYRLSDQPLRQETPYREMIRVICDKLQKQLYPNQVLRMLHRLGAAFIDRPKYLKAHRELLSNDLSRLRKVFESRGLEVFARKLEYYLDHERDRISIPAAGQLDAHRTVTLSQDLEKDGKGRYQLTGMDAGIYGSLDPGDDISIRIDQEFSLSRVQIGNLLQQRPVYVLADQHSSPPRGQWLQVGRYRDQGDFRVNVFGPEYGYDLKVQLEQLATETGIYRVTAIDVITQLEEGHQVKLAGRHPLDQPVLIEASPATKGILIRDIQQHVADQDGLFLGTKQAQEKQRGIQVMSALLRKENSNQQDQSFGIGS